MQYVYALSDEEGKVFYVGKGKKGRWLKHKTDTAKLKTRTGRRIAAMLSSGRRILCCPMLAFPNNEDAILFEKRLISHWGRLDRGTGVLTNHTDGGDGTLGATPNAETRAKIAATKIGRVFTADTRAKMAAARTGRKCSDETRAKVAEARRNTIASKEKMSKKPRQSVTMADPQAEYLKRRAESLGISVSEYLRRIIDRDQQENAA